MKNFNSKKNSQKKEEDSISNKEAFKKILNYKIFSQEKLNKNCLKVLIDTSLILDVLLDRNSIFLHSIIDIMNLVLSKALNGYITELGLQDIWEISQKLKGQEDANYLVIKLLNSFNFCRIDSEMIKRAREYHLNSLETGIQLECAKRHQLDAIISLKDENFLDYDFVAVLSPSQFLESYNSGSQDFLKKVNLSFANPYDRQLAAEIRLRQRFYNLTPIDYKTAISDYITWGEYQLFLNAQKTEQFHSSAEIIQIPPGQESQPVTGISAKDARWFCAWLSTLTSLQSEDVVYDYFCLPTSVKMKKAVHQGITDNSYRSIDFLRVVRVQLPKRYKDLLNYLANGCWDEADRETGDVMLEVAGQKKRGYLMPDDIEKFPCEDLHTIDRLWLKFSGGHFGFSVQKNIYQSLGGTKEFNQEVWNNFGDRVGWRKGRNWLNYADLTWHLNAPKGHLPIKRIEKKDLSDHDRLKGEYISAIVQKSFVVSRT